MNDALIPTLDLVDYRRRVAAIYAEVRHRGVDRGSWEWWRAARNDLLSTHPQSPLGEQDRGTEEPVRYFDYDPTWHVVGTVDPTSTADGSLVLDGQSSFAEIGSVVFERAGREHTLGLYWLEAYGGGLFLPFRDATSGVTTYGGGRYLLDGAKSADLGSAGPGELVLDFNFSYHPSCAWDPVWTCPLAPPSNKLDIEVEAGERS